MQVSAEGKKPVALEYEERAHDFPGMVWFHDSAVLVPVCSCRKGASLLIRKGLEFELVFRFLAFSGFSLIFLVLENG